MYKISSGENVVYSNTAVFIRLSQNGSYVSNADAEAEGVCVKIARDKTDESGRTYTDVADEVYRILPNGLNGTEPLATIIEIEGKAPLTVNQERIAALRRIDGKCSAAIYSGVTVGDKHYKLTATAQGNLATAQAKVDGGAESVIYAADDEEPTLHTAEQITAISDAAYKWGVVNTSYYAKLQKWIARETDETTLATIDYGSTLPDDLMQELGTLLSGAGINLADYAGLLNGGK